MKINSKKEIKSFTKNERFSIFSNKNEHLFYSGVFFVKNKLLKKNLKKNKKDFELNLFNKFIRNHKTKVFLDNRGFKDFNNLEDIQDLKK